jgi:heme exporter protein CcmD
MSSTNEWFYIWLAFGLTWMVVGGYAVWLRARRTAAETDLRTKKGGQR